MPLTLVSHPLCPYVQRAVIALVEKGVAFERIDIDLADKPDWFRALSPLGRVPVLRIANAPNETDPSGAAEATAEALSGPAGGLAGGAAGAVAAEPAGGSAIFESAVIVEYLDETEAPCLHPADPLDRARHRAWIEAASATLAGIARFYNAPDEAAIAREGEAITVLLARVGEEVEGPFFAGSRFTLVDAAWAPVFRYLDAFERRAGIALAARLPRIAAWRAQLARRASVRAAVAPDYAERLDRFLAARSGALAKRIAGRISNRGTGSSVTT